MVKRKPLFITFIGIDGSGKTTQAKELVDFLRARGIPTAYVTNQFESWTLTPLAKIGKLFFLRRKDMRTDYAEFSTSVKKLFGNRFASSIYRNYHLALQLLHSLIKIRIPLRRGKSVVSERYIYDFIAGLTFEHGYNKEKLAPVLNRLWRLMPRPDLLFFIDVQEDVAYRRKDDIPCLDYLKERRKAYAFIAEQEVAVILDGAAEVTLLQTMIQDNYLNVFKGV